MLACLGLTGCGQSNQLGLTGSKVCQKDQVMISITGQGGGEYCVSIADDDIERARGLMYVESMPENEGMLFVFNDEDVRYFWMMNTLIPLDILFFDAGGSLVDIKNDFQPCESSLNCQSYESQGKAKYVLEVNSNQFDGGETELSLEYTN